MRLHGSHVWVCYTESPNMWDCQGKMLNFSIWWVWEMLGHRFYVAPNLNFVVPLTKRWWQTVTSDPSFKKTVQKSMLEGKYKWMQNLKLHSCRSPRVHSLHGLAHALTLSLGISCFVLLWIFFTLTYNPLRLGGDQKQQTCLWSQQK